MVNKDTRYYLDSVQYTKAWKHRVQAVLPIIAIIVVAAVFWWLKLTGITMAGEAFCGYDEHTHDPNCVEAILICNGSETEISQPVLICDLTEHTHGAACMTVTLHCTEEHEHTEECFIYSLVCDIDEHTHEEGCYAEDDTVYKHNHTESCYDISNICGMEEHIHTPSCYSDINADLESADDWELTLPYVYEEMSLPERIVAVAESQLGYEESIRNFTVDAFGVRHGYTRYGEWYGNPYGEWSVMFVSFCLRYAGMDEIPVSAGAETMRIAWETEGVYKNNGEYTPIAGDIVFLDTNGNAYAESAAIIIDYDTDFITVIEGNLDDAVRQNCYAIDDERIIGYGLSSPESNLMILEKPGFVPEPEFEIELDLEAETGFVPEPEFEVQLDLEAETGFVPEPEFEIELDLEAETGFVPGPEFEVQLDLEADSEPEGETSASESTEEQNNMMFAAAPAAVTYYVWLDGTNGGLKSCSGSPNTRYDVNGGDSIKLPSEWQSPTQYGYTLRGWYDVTNSIYYAPGTEVTVTGNMVLYADWVPATYDIGRFNAQTSNTISTNHIITTHVFDYNYLFNVMSSRASVRVDENSHSESWSHAEEGTVSYQNAPTLDFIFKDNDSGGKLSLANGRSYNNDYHQPTTVSAGIYTPELGEVLFGTDNGFDPETGGGIIGKTYLGQGDYLFQYMDNPNSEYYGYYYFDSKLHAASYNQSEQRFYVYDYLARSSDSSGQSGEDRYSDFLPLNSPYANTNGKTPDTYTYNGDLDEYRGVDHFEYDVSYSDTHTVGANMAFGMSMEMKFYLPAAPGTTDENGEYVNQDLYGNEMSYTFSGDDDVWVLVDGEVRLDIGGIHQIVSGTINFSTGEVIVNGRQTETLSDLAPGDHTLTVYYLERGSSQSNCAMYFNLAPRYSLTIQKEDVLTQELLDGAEFSVYTDPECETPAQLWESEYDYQRDAEPQNTFTVEDGYTYLWGMSPGKTYYIRETRPPDNPGYDRAVGTIRFEFDIKGTATFNIEIIEEEPGDGISPGYTVHGYHINTESQAAYITVTNAQSWVDEVTTVQIVKRWEDSVNHSEDYVTVYLTVTDEDGTVRRIREAVLGEENHWSYTWTNLPKYAADGVTEVAYGAEESYSPGYSSIVERVDKIVDTDETWESYSFVDGEEYLLKTSHGYLSASNASSQTIRWISEEEAKNTYGAEHSLSTWVASVSGGTVKLTNKNGQILTFNNGNNSSKRYFYLTKSSADNQKLTYANTSSGYRLYYKSSRTKTYYASTLNSSDYLSSTTSTSDAVLFTPMILQRETTEIEVQGIAYTITNTPLEAETSLKVTKYWDTGLAVNVPYETSQVTIRLLADGKDTGRTVTLNLKNAWTDTFMGLPYYDDAGNVISYDVVEIWNSNDWEPIYGEIRAVGDGIPTYETTVTNVYKYGHGYELPSTGGCGSAVWVLSGCGLMTFSLVSGYILNFHSRRRVRK